MNDREAIRRLTLNSGDCSAVSWLHHNHTVAIHAIVTRAFGNGPLAEKAEYDLMQRIAARARSFKSGEGCIPQWHTARATDCLKAAHPDLRIIYMSGYTSDTIVHHGVLRDGIDFIEKPFSEESLMRKLREVLDR